MEVVILCTTPGRSESEKIAEVLLEKQLIACANVLDSVQSLFSWDGAMQNEKENLMVIKSHAGHFEAIEAIVNDLHPYDVPELIALPILKGNKAYMEWLRESVNKKDEHHAGN